MGDVEEQQSSSGIIVSTGLGSTGWLKSILAGAAGVANNILNGRISLKPAGRFEWSSDYLYFSVREPLPSKTTGASLVFGTITRGEPFQVLSQMPENGVIFSDGIEADFLSFNSGVMARIEVAEKKGRLVIWLLDFQLRYFKAYG